MSEERIQKLIARAGIAARRKAEELITSGRVKVNDQVVTELGTKADPERDKIEVDGRRLHMPRTPTYIVLWKPTGVVTTANDELNRRTVIDLVQCDARVFPVGRLDYDAEGLLLLTDDGDLAAALTHPSGHVEKVYRCRVVGFVRPDALKTLETGVELEDGPAQATRARLIYEDGPHRGPAWVELAVTEGRNHLVKRMLQAVGHPVTLLRRVRFGPLELDDLRPGKWRNLRRDEVARLRAAATRAKKNRRAGPQKG